MRSTLSICLIFLLLTEVAGQSPAADLVLFNGNVRTMDRANPRAEAFAVADGRIIAVGTNKTIRTFAGKGTKVIDAGGKLVLPGFNDSHVHFMSIGNLFSSIDLSGARSADEMAEKIAYFTRFLPKGRWILGGKWNNERWRPGEMPSLEKIDAVSPDNPVFVYHSDPQTAFANSLALGLAKVGVATKAIGGGEIVRDSDRRPTGVLKGNAIRLVQSVVPASHTRNWAEMAETASNYAASLGVTSVQDMHSDDLADTYRLLVKQGRLKTRIYDCVGIADWRKLAAAGIKAAKGDEMIRVGCVKGFSEGDEDEAVELQNEVAAIDKTGIQVMMHAIGENANSIVLEAFEKASAANGPRDRRFRVEHAHGFRDRDLPRFGRSNIIPSMQPFLFYTEDAGTKDDFRSLLMSGARTAFGSDGAIVDLNPLQGIHAAVNAGGKRSITVEEAIYAYTLGSAYAEFRENEKGSIEVGKLADFVVLTDDIFSTEFPSIRNVRVLQTVMNGRVTHEAR